MSSESPRISQDLTIYPLFGSLRNHNNDRKEDFQKNRLYKKNNNFSRVETIWYPSLPYLRVKLPNFTICGGLKGTSKRTKKKTRDLFCHIT